MIDKWFASEFVRGMKLSVLKQIYNSGVLDLFIEMLSKRSDADRITVIEKIDKYNVQAPMLTKRQAFAHIEQLACGAIKPVTKSRDAAKKKKYDSSTSVKDLIADSKY